MTNIGLGCVCLGGADGLLGQVTTSDQRTLCIWLDGVSSNKELADDYI